MVLDVGHSHGQEKVEPPLQHHRLRPGMYAFAFRNTSVSEITRPRPYPGRHCETRIVTLPSATKSCCKNPDLDPAYADKSVHSRIATISMIKTPSPAILL